jgi:hypothetical protein
LWLRASSSGAADVCDKCCGFGHQARALLMFVISVVASGIKLGLMEFVSLRCSDVMSHCFVWLLILLLVRCFVPLFCLVAYFDVGPLFRPVVLFR